MLVFCGRREPRRWNKAQAAGWVLFGLEMRKRGPEVELKTSALVLCLDPCSRMLDYMRRGIRWKRGQSEDLLPVSSNIIFYLSGPGKSLSLSRVLPDSLSS